MVTRRHNLAWLALSAAIAAGACHKPEKQPSPYLGDVEVLRDDILLTTGSVGEGKFEGVTTYALVDVRNTSERDLLVTLGGQLEDGAGNQVAELSAQSLRVPSGGMRMFSMVDSENRSRPEAKAAKVEVLGAIAPSYAPPVIVSDGRVDIDDGKAVAQGYVVNTAERRVAVIVIGGFYDADRKPLSQTSTKLTIDGGEKRGVMLAGPAGSKSGYLFIGEYAY